MQKLGVFLLPLCLAMGFSSGVHAADRTDLTLSDLLAELSEEHEPGGTECNDLFDLVSESDPTIQRRMAVQSRIIEEQQFHNIFDTWVARHAIAQVLYDFARMAESSDPSKPVDIPRRFSAWRFLGSLPGQPLTAEFRKLLSELVDRMIDQIAQAVPRPLDSLEQGGIRPLQGRGLLGLPIWVRELTQEQANTWNEAIVTSEGRATLKTSLFFKLYRPKGWNYRWRIHRGVRGLILKAEAAKKQELMGKVTQNLQLWMTRVTFYGGLATALATLGLSQLPTYNLTIPVWTHQLDSRYPQSQALSEQLPKIQAIKESAARSVSVRQFNTSFSRTMGVSDFLQLIVASHIPPNVTDREATQFVRTNLQGLSVSELLQVCRVIRSNAIQDQLIVEYASSLRGPLDQGDEKLLLRAVGSDIRDQLNQIFASEEYRTIPKATDRDPDTGRYFPPDLQAAKTKFTVVYPYDSVKGWEFNAGHWLKEGADAGTQRPRFSAKIEATEKNLRVIFKDPVLSQYKRKLSSRYGVDEFKVKVIVGPVDGQKDQLAIERIEITDNTMVKAEDQVMFRVRGLPQGELKVSDWKSILSRTTSDDSIYGAYRLGSPVTLRFKDLRLSDLNISKNYGSNSSTQSPR